MKDKELDIDYFLSFCIEQYGKKHRLSGDEVVSMFDRYEVLPYFLWGGEFLWCCIHKPNSG